MIEQTAMSKLYSYIQVAYDLGAKQVDTFTLLRLINEFKELEKNQIYNKTQEIKKSEEL